MTPQEILTEPEEIPPPRGNWRLIFIFGTSFLIMMVIGLGLLLALSYARDMSREHGWSVHGSMIGSLAFHRAPNGR